jgi:hypothetical protein
MKKFCMLLLLLLAHSARAQAPVDVLIEVDRGRTESFFSSKPVVQRAILMKPAVQSDTALLMFRGAPGYSRIETVKDKFRNVQNFIRPHMRLFMEAGIALVVMDCPTDQWGEPGFYPTSCLDSYRMSAQHADDVRSLMARLRQDHGYSRFYLIGHSAGSVSSRWLAKNLGNEIAGSIHSAAINADRRPGAPWASVMDFPYKSIVAPVLHLHHESDGCSYTQHGVTRSYAGGRLTTVRGGTVKTTDPCALHHHSYEGAEEAVSLAVINWIKTGKVEPFVGE